MVGVYLPAAAIRDAGWRNGTGREIGGHGALFDGLIGTALLVDDEALVRASTADLLVYLGYAVVEAGTAELLPSSEAAYTPIIDTIIGFLFYPSRRATSADICRFTPPV